MVETDNKKMYTVKEVAEMFEVSPHTVRYYTDMGLIPSLVRDKNNNRMFNKESLNWFRACFCLKGCGMSIKDLKRYISLCLKGDSTVKERYQMILKYKEIAEINYKNAKKMLDFAEFKVEYYKDIIAGKIPDESNPSVWNKGKKSCN